MPLARYFLYSQGVDIWAAPTLAPSDGWIATMRHIALEGRCYVIGVNPCLRADQIPADFPHRDRLWSTDPDAQDWVEPGNSVIVDPRGTILAGPARQRGDHPVRRGRPGGRACRPPVLRPSGSLQPPGHLPAECGHATSTPGRPAGAGRRGSARDDGDPRAPTPRLTARLPSPSGRRPAVRSRRSAGARRSRHRRRRRGAARRVDLALTESARLLRTSMSQLHPAVIESTGLLPALRDLVEATRARGRFAITLNSDGWADDDRTGADELLLTTARELLTNVVKHAARHHGQDRAPPRSRGRLAEGDRRRPWHGRRRSLQPARRGSPRSGVASDPDRGSRWCPLHPPGGTARHRGRGHRAGRHHAARTSLPLSRSGRRLTGEMFGLRPNGHPGPGSSRVGRGADDNRRSTYASRRDRWDRPCRTVGRTRAARGRARGRELRRRRSTGARAPRRVLSGRPHRRRQGLRRTVPVPARGSLSPGRESRAEWAGADRRLRQQRRVRSQPHAGSRRRGRLPRRLRLERDGHRPADRWRDARADPVR